MASEQEHQAMRRAATLAARGRGTTSPNPVVGCVLLGSDGVTVVGEGWHERAGGPHAEVNALTAAGERAAGGTAVVTLEPCSHVGRTGPCTEALLAAGVARVVVGVADPNPVAAGGAAVLRAAGIDVETGVEQDAASAVNEHWLHATRNRRPFVIWKYAATLDGRSAAADGSSRWITGSAARTDVHRLRAEVDAVLVGVGTVLADDPALTVRHVRDVAVPHQPIRVVLDSDGRTPATARVRDDAAPTWILTTDDVPRHDVDAVLTLLFERGVRSVLLEGGPTLAGAFLDAGRIDEIIGYVAPALLGQGKPALVARSTGSTIDRVARLHLIDVTPLDGDLRLTARPAHEGV